jgi:hypothetical protein
MKKFLTILCFAAVVFVFVACGSKAEVVPPPPALIDFDVEDDDDLHESVNIGDIIELGAIDLDAPLNWIVLDVRGGRALVLSEMTLYRGMFNPGETTWEESGLREYLNDYFIYDIFNEEEQARISEALVVNSDNYISGAPGGNNNTYDRLFLLSIDEVERLMGEDAPSSVRDAMLAPFYFNPDGEPGTNWWLRSPGVDNHYAAYVNWNGSLRAFGEPVYSDFGVRPAMWMYLFVSDGER